MILEDRPNFLVQIFVESGIIRFAEYPGRLGNQIGGVRKEHGGDHVLIGMTVRLPVKLARAVAARARKERRSQSDLVRELIVKCMEEPSVERDVQLLREELQAVHQDVKQLLKGRGGVR